VATGTGQVTPIRKRNPVECRQTTKVNLEFEIIKYIGVSHPL